MTSHSQSYIGEGLHRVRFWMTLHWQTSALEWLRSCGIKLVVWLHRVEFCSAWIFVTACKCNGKKEEGEKKRKRRDTFVRWRLSPCPLSNYLLNSSSSCLPPPPPPPHTPFLLSCSIPPQPLSVVEHSTPILHPFTLLLDLVAVLLCSLIQLGVVLLYTQCQQQQQSSSRRQCGHLPLIVTLKLPSAGWKSLPPCLMALWLWSPDW